MCHKLQYADIPISDARAPWPPLIVPMCRCSVLQNYGCVLVQEQVGVDEVMERHRTSTQPLLFRCQQRLWIKTDSVAIPVSDSLAFVDAVELLLACFWVFNVKYPHELRPSYSLLELLLHIVVKYQLTSAKELLRSLAQFSHWYSPTHLIFEFCSRNLQIIRRYFTLKTQTHASNSSIASTGCAKKVAPWRILLIFQQLLRAIT